jgi:hypothetical protein
MANMKRSAQSCCAGRAKLSYGTVVTLEELRKPLRLFSAIERDTSGFCMPFNEKENWLRVVYDVKYERALLLK